MSGQIEHITPVLQQYIRSHSLREHAVLQELRLETSQMEYARMEVAPELAQFLQLLIRLMNARHIIELGTFTGYSALAMALALPSDGKLITCDISKEWTDIAQRYWQQAEVAAKIELKLAPALDSLQQMRAAGKDNSFDLVFIDADKNNYTAYYQQALELLRPGGLIAVDNALWHGHVADPTMTDNTTRSIDQLNEFASQDQRVFLSLLPIADGLLLAQKIK